MGSIGEFFVTLGVKADTYTVKDFTKAIGDIPLSVAGAISALAAIDLTFLSLTSKALDMSNSLGMFRSETGLSTQELQKWQNAARQFGVQGDTVSSSIKGIENSIVQLTRFGNTGVAQAFGRLGIQAGPGRNPFQVLMDLRDKYRKMDKGYMASLLPQIGVSPEMMRLFELSPERFNKAMSAPPAFNNDSMRAMEDLQQQLAVLNNTVMVSFVQVLKELEPYMGDLTKALVSLVEILGGTVIKTAGFWAQQFNQEQGKGALGYAGEKAGGFIKSIPDIIGSVMGTSQMDYMMGKYVADKTREQAVNQTMNVTNNVYGADSADAMRRSTEEAMAASLTRAAKHFGRVKR